MPKTKATKTSLLKYIGEYHENGVELEIYECGCGFHIGLDATFLDQVGGIEVPCPSCGDIIHVEEIE